MQILDEPNPATKVKQETDKLLRMLKEAQGLDDALVMLSSVQSVTKLVTDQGAVYAEICRLADACQLDLSSVGKKLKFPGANVEESARIALENMNVLNECALEIASKHDNNDLNGKQFTASLTLPMGIGVDAANVVTEVDPEGAGGQAGLKVGDEMLWVDGMEVRAGIVPLPEAIDREASTHPVVMRRAPPPCRTRGLAGHRRRCTRSSRGACFATLPRLSQGAGGC